MVGGLIDEYGGCHDDVWIEIPRGRRYDGTVPNDVIPRSTYVLY